MKKKIVILGAAESGVGAAILAQAQGFDTFVSDKGSIQANYKATLEAHKIAWEEGGHTEHILLSADEIIKSPGIPETIPLLQKAKAKDIPILSEIEFAGRYTNAKTICISGSNGKTTTSMLTYHVLKQAGMDVGLAGNIGKSFAWQVAEDPHAAYVLELSSFQLDNMYRFKADIAILLNITPDHLDRYEYQMQNYVQSKFRLLQNQTAADAFVYWSEDPIMAKEIAQHAPAATCYPFAEAQGTQTKAYCDGENMVVEVGEKHFTMPRETLSLAGKHNLYNAMAAATAARLIGVEADTLRTALATFPGVEHRIEPVATVQGVAYINDSKATNVNSCWYALESMTRPTVLILGGKDKGNDYEEIAPLVREKVHTLICMGVDNSKLLAFFEGIVPKIVDTHSIEEAVEQASRHAHSGDVVLLSPCCASFDLFNSYEDRGRQFKECVKRKEL